VIRRPAVRAVAISVALLAMAGCASGGGPQRRGPPLQQTANASAVIAREFAFALAAQERGQWAAFTEFSAPEAVLYVPERTRAQDWLKRRPPVVPSARWQPHAVWSSCDGSMAVTHGAWQRGEDARGQYLVVWRRDGGGPYRWVLQLDGALAQSLVAPEMITAQAASCVRAEPGSPASGRPPGGPGNAAPGAPADPLMARDGSLSVRIDPAVGGGQNVRVNFMRDGAAQDVLSVRLDGSGMGAR